VDLVVATPNRGLLLLEVKATTTPRPDMASSVARLAKNIKDDRVTAAVLHRSRRSEVPIDALYPGVKAVPVDRLPELLTHP
jgi:hypothetical protein